MLDPPSIPVFACFCTIFFDNMVLPWGGGWRKCDPRSSVDAPSTLRRRSLDAPPMFPEASKNRPKKTLIFGCLFGSILALFLNHFWTSGPRRGRQQALKAPSEQVYFSNDLFGPHNRGGGPPPLETLRHALRCPATSAHRGHFRRKMKGSLRGRGQPNE